MQTNEKRKSKRISLTGNFLLKTKSSNINGSIIDISYAGIGCRGNFDRYEIIPDNDASIFLYSDSIFIAPLPVTVINAITYETTGKMTRISSIFGALDFSLKLQLEYFIWKCCLKRKLETSL
jgi:hypothetical protein